MNVADVNIIRKSKASEEHVFKDRESRKAKSDVDWENEE